MRIVTLLLFLLVVSSPVLAVEVRSSISLGSVTSGATVEESLIVRNPSSREYTNLNFNSDVYSVSSNVTKLDPNSNKTIKIVFRNVDERAGMIEFSGQNGTKEFSERIIVQADISTSDERVRKLESWIKGIGLRNLTQSEEKKLNRTAKRLETLEFQYNSGKYGEAKETYNNITEELEDLQESSGEISETLVERRTSNENKDESGKKINPIYISVLFIVLLIVLILYLSITPE